MYLPQNQLPVIDDNAKIAALWSKYNDTHEVDYANFIRTGRFEMIPKSEGASAFDVNDIYNGLLSGMTDLQKEQIQAQADAARIQREFEQSSADKAMDFEAEQAQLQRDWQSSANQLAMDFEADQAQLNRDFQEAQRRNQYQVAMADMKAAGLNPILAYNRGGAGTTSGAMASGFTSSGSSASGFKANGSKADVDTRTTVEVMQTLVSSASQLIGSLASSAASLVGSARSASSSRYAADASAFSRIASSRYGSKFFK